MRRGRNPAIREPSPQNPGATLGVTDNEQHFAALPQKGGPEWVVVNSSG